MCETIFLFGLFGHASGGFLAPGGVRGPPSGHGAVTRLLSRRRAGRVVVHPLPAPGRPRRGGAAAGWRRGPGEGAGGPAGGGPGGRGRGAPVRAERVGGPAVGGPPGGRVATRGSNG